MLWLVVGVGAAGMAWAGDAPAPAASSNTPPTDADSSAKGPTNVATPPSSASDSVGKATLASWLDLLAAQRASEVIGTAVNASIGDGPVLLSRWEDYVRDVDDGRVVQGQIAYSKTIITAYRRLLAAAQKASRTKACVGEATPPEPVKHLLSEPFGHVRTTTRGGSLPSGFNTGLAAVQTMLGVIKAISDTVRPSVSEPSPTRVGLAGLDLYPATTSSSPPIYVTPVIAKSSDDAYTAATVSDSLALAGQMTELATQIGDRGECKTLVEKLTQSATALRNLVKALQPDPASGTSAVDEALAMLNLSKKNPNLTILDIQLISEDATDRGYSTLIPTSKRLMQSSVLARYRLLNGTTGHVLRSGTVAAFCQVVAREGVLGAEAFGNKISSADMCRTIP